MYAVGDKVVHPMHGAGVIEGIREIEIVGKKSKYYTVRFAMGSMVTNIPIENCENIGIRDVIDKNEAKALLSIAILFIDFARVLIALFSRFLSINAI